jgi:hypothetical protein
MTLRVIVRLLPALCVAFALFGNDLVPGRPDLVYQQPQIAGSGQNAGIVFGAGDTIYYSASRDNGQSFNPPTVVASIPKLSLGNHRGPRIAFAAGVIVVTAGVSSPAAQYGPNTLYAWRSKDGGATWSSGIGISNSEAAGMGFHALASDGQQRLWSVWLGPQNGRVMLFGAHTEDSGASWSKPRIIYESTGGSVCECCHPSVAIGEDGGIFVMFRNSMQGARDLYLAVSQDTGQTFHATKLGQGTWPINACPMDGGGLSLLGGDAITAWRRNSEIFIARPGGKREESLGTGRNPAVALRKTGYYAVWTSSEGVVARVPGRAAPYVLAKTGAFPSIAPAGPLVAAWEDHGTIRTVLLK